MNRALLAAIMGRDRSRVVFAYEAPNSFALSVLAPQGCGFARAASFSSVQWGTASVLDLSGSAAVANLLFTGTPDDALPYGLVLEEARTNLVLARDTSAASWSRFGGATHTGGQASVVFLDNNAGRIQAPSGGGLGETVASASAAPFTTSAWLRSWSGTAAPNYNTFRTTAGRVAISTTVGTAWTRLSQTLSGAGGETSALLPVDGRDWSGIGGLVAGARDFVVDCPQRELGSFPTEWIPTAGSARTRAASFFWMLAASVAPALFAGRIAVELHLRSKGARTEFSGTTSLWWIDANNHASFVPSTGVLTIAVGGSTNTCTLPSWARLDELRIFVEAGGGVATRVRYSINGAARVDLAITGSALGTLSAGDLYVCSTSTGQHLSCWLYAARLWRVGRSPAWAG